MRNDGDHRNLGSRVSTLLAGFLAVFTASRSMGQELAVVVPRSVVSPDAVERVRPLVASTSASPRVAGVAHVERRSVERPAGALSPSVGVVETPELRSVGGEQSVFRLRTPPRERRRSRDVTPPWVGVQSLTPPHIETEELFKQESASSERIPWYVAEQRGIQFEAPPPYVDYRPLPLFHIEPPKLSLYARALKTVARRKFYSELRRRAKRSWRDVYANRPRMDYGEFEEGMLAISRLGREPSRHDPFSADYYTTEFKEDLFSRSYREGESDVPLVAWGPLVVTDAGSLRVDLARVKNLKKFFMESEEVKLETGEGAGESFLATEAFRIRTNLRLHFDPLGPVEEGDPTWAIKRYGVAVTVDWLSDVLAKEMFSAEIEAEFERDGDFGVGINFLIEGGH